MATTDTTLRKLIRLIDKDFNDVRTSQFERQSLFYTVKIDNRQTDILGRKARVPDNNARKVSFLIRTPLDNSSHTTLYLTEIDIINILSTLDKVPYEHIRNHLVKIYRGENDPSAHTVQLYRTALVPDVGDKTLVANRDVLAMPLLSDNPDINTPFGFVISLQSFCDVLWMILSAENELKLKITVTKYCVFSSLLRGQPLDMRIPILLAHVRTIKDVEEIYSGMRPKDAQRYDADTFIPQVQTDFFESI